MLNYLDGCINRWMEEKRERGSEARSSITVSAVVERAGWGGVAQTHSRRQLGDKQGRSKRECVDRCKYKSRTEGVSAGLFSVIVVITSLSLSSARHSRRSPFWRC